MPVLAVLNELAKLDNTLEVVFVCDKAFENQARGIMEHADIPVEVKVIAAGKLRRYKDMSLLQHLLDKDIMKGNVLDIGKIVRGFGQSLLLLRKEKPDVVFAKGGYVCLPVGIAAKLLGIPLVIHDSDARPGLTNKVLSRYAAQIATGTPRENYPYRDEITTYTGVPVDGSIRPFSDEDKRRARDEFGIIDLSKPLVVATGGGLGAESINTAMVSIAPSLLERGLTVYHVTGRAHFEAVEKQAPHHPDYHVVPFIYDGMTRLLGAADVVISRGSATFLQELAALAKPTIIIPAKQLGDQQKNAELYQRTKAGIVLSDDDLSERPELLEKAIGLILDNPAASRTLGANLAAFAKPDAARDVAQLIYNAGSVARKKRHEA